MFNFINSIRARLAGHTNEADSKHYILTNFDIPPEGFFTSSELDQLKKVISEYIRAEEGAADYIRFVAKNVVPKSIWQREMRKSKKRIKLLANLQRKIKYSLITMG